MRGRKLVDQLKGGVKAEALGTNTEFGNKVTCVVFLHLDDTDPSHAVESVEGTLIGQVIVVLKNRQILEMRRDLHEAGNNRACGRKCLSTHLNFDHVAPTASERTTSK